MAPFAVSRGFQRPTGCRAQAALRRPLGRILLLEDASLAVPIAGGYPHDAVAPLVHRDVARLAEKNRVIFVRLPVPAHVAALCLFVGVLHGRHHLHLQLVIPPCRFFLVALLLRLGLRRRRRGRVPAQLFLVEPTTFGFLSVFVFPFKHVVPPQRGYAKVRVVLKLSRPLRHERCYVFGGDVAKVLLVVREERRVVLVYEGLPWGHRPLLRPLSLLLHHPALLLTIGIVRQGRLERLSFRVGVRQRGGSAEALEAVPAQIR
mmetsp:Transcript_5624/g.23037  ORF Transcript_5624/g.23037 Transcript_5624/m.23037 type:complete len:261 (-) Transcript_5624:171-953(-)